MNLEYRAPLCSRGWKPVKSGSLEEAAIELATIRDMWDIQVRNADTKEIVQLPAPYGYNAGRMCDTPPGGGPCSCGAWH